MYAEAISQGMLTDLIGKHKMSSSKNVTKFSQLEELASLAAQTGYLVLSSDESFSPVLLKSSRMLSWQPCRRVSNSIKGDWHEVILILFFFHPWDSISNMDFEWTEMVGFTVAERLNGLELWMTLYVECLAIGCEHWAPKWIQITIWHLVTLSLEERDEILI
jgi:hypothetical protein